MAQPYQLTSSSSGYILRVADSAFIPPDLGNKDYQAYQAWTSAGNTPDPYVAPTPTALDSANATLAGGLAITSTATPALNGTYSIDATAQSNINATVTYILLNGTFPGGSATMAWLDASGGSHVFPSVAEFKSFATAVASYVAAVIQYGQSSGTLGSIPSQPIAIP